MDGGSTDETSQLLAGSTGSVQWKSEPDRGQADAVNKAFQASEGEIVGWVNSDDGLFARDAVERVVEAFRRHPDAGVVYGDAALVDESGLILRHHRSRWPGGTLPIWSPIAQPATFFRRSVIDQEPVLRVDLHRFLDYELWLRLRSRGVRFVHLPLVVAVDRDHPQRKLRADDDLSIRECEQLVEEYGPVLAVPRLRRLRSFIWRLRGVPQVWTWEQHEPGFPWRVDGRLARLMRQVARLNPLQLTPEQLEFGRQITRSGSASRFVR
jgi:glycosyltransferase involved in cell wall biosynthesis